jgi:AcrR family transcriptional regulator
LAAALKVFGVEGFEAPVLRIIEVADVPVGTFYRMFPDKYAVASRLFDEATPQILERVASRVDAEADPKLRLRNAVEEMILVGAREFGDVVRLYFHSVRGHPQLRDAVALTEKRDVEFLAAYIRDALGADARNRHPEVLARAALGAIAQTMGAYVSGNHRPALAVAAAEVADMVTAGVVRSGGER